MKLKNVCPYRVGQRVCCPQFGRVYEPIIRLEHTQYGVRVWVQTSDRESYWPEEFANNGRLTIQDSQVDIPELQVSEIVTPSIFYSID